jgi:hypothetical protein
MGAVRRGEAVAREGRGGQNMSLINRIKRSWRGTSGRDRADPVDFFDLSTPPYITKYN